MSADANTQAHEGRHLPRPTPLSQPWWDACRKGELLLQRCSGCGHAQFYPRIICTACGHDAVEWVRASGLGTILSYTVIRHPVSPAYQADVPYILALVELEEGAVMMSTIADCEPEVATIGMPVEVSFEKWTDTITMPRFQPR
jgi:uncharacterized OB-fold protein